MYFDSHAHYDDESFDEDRDELLKGMKEKGVGIIINAAAELNSCKTGIELANKYSHIYCSVGVHPHDVAMLKASDIDVIREFAKEKRVVAIGEIGLDYYYDTSPREIQREWFEKQLLLAKELELPVIVHSRDASQETFDIIEKSGVREGVIHCFSGSHELAKEYIKRGFYIGVGGTLTFKNAKKTVKVVEEISIENILIETDAPYLTPVPHRGKRNESTYLEHVVSKIAEIKQITSKEVEDVTYANAKQLFKI